MISPIDQSDVSHQWIARSAGPVSVYFDWMGCTDQCDIYIFYVAYSPQFILFNCLPRQVKLFNLPNCSLHSVYLV